MISDCKSCGMYLGKEHPQLNDMCIDCFADSWGELVEKSPMVSPHTLYEMSLRENLSEKDFFDENRIEIGIYSYLNRYRK